MRRLILVAAILIGLGVARGNAQVAVPGSITVTQSIVANAVTATDSQTAVLTGVSGKFTCVQEVQVTLASASAVVAGELTISDGTWTVPAELVDTVSAGAYYQWGGPGSGVLQSSAVDTSVTVTVPALATGGGGYVTITGYFNAGGC